MNLSPVELYQHMVAWARHPFFYHDLKLADHVLVRFEMLALHLALLLRRFKVEQVICQDLVDLFVQDMDACVRELPVSDLKINKEVRRLVQAFYGRLHALNMILDTHNQLELSTYFERNLFVHSSHTPNTAKSALVLYVFFLNQWLQHHNAVDFLTGVSPLVLFHANYDQQREA